MTPNLPPRNDLAVRVSQLEKALARSNRRSMLLVAAGLSVLVVGARQGPEAVEAERFAIRDANGVARIVLEVSDNGIPYIALHDTENARRLMLSLDPDGTPAVSLLDKQEKHLTNLMIGPDGPHLTMLDDQGEPTVYLGMNTDRLPLLSLRRRDNRSRIDMSLDRDVPAWLSFLEEGTKRIVLGVTDHGVARVDVMGREPKDVSAALIARPDGDARLNISSPTQKVGCALGVTPTGSADLMLGSLEGRPTQARVSVVPDEFAKFVLVDPTGKVLTRLPEETGE